MPTRIGIVTTWMERAAAYVSRQYCNVLSGRSIVLRLRNFVFLLLTGIGGLQLLAITEIGRRFMTLSVAGAGARGSVFSLVHVPRPCACLDLLVEVVSHYG